MLRRAALVFSLILAACSLGAGQSTPITVTPTKGPDIPTQGPPISAPLPSDAPQLKPAELDSRPSLTSTTKMQLIRVLDAEFVHVRKYFPVGEKDMMIGDDGTVRPGDAQLYKMAQIQGTAAKVGDRVQITNILFRDKSIYFEINGGPRKKSKWYQHIEIGMGGSTGGVDPNGDRPTGAAITVEFKKHVPEMTGAELKLLLGPVLDFSVKTAAEVFVDTMPPKIKAAVKSHEVLVGMNHDMVVMAKDRPQQKVREKDEQGRDYEEWIYGVAPQDVVFVRFIGDEVVQVKIAKVGGQIVVKTEKEIQVVDGVPTMAALKSSTSPQDVSGAPQPDQPAHRPTLKRPDEQPEPVVPQANGTSGTQAPDPHQEEPQWGTGGKQSPASPPPPNSQQAPSEPVKQPPL
ncbi:MAG: hypothetical protein WA738_12980 [Candidatus Angelobacter sp.]